ncbi:MAG: hypothetical protein ILP12_07460 [Lachnospiraceae bacterium]|nr:hypothetical protein [Lachnospiraceae bacterium]
MKETDVYERYFEGRCKVNGRMRHAAQVKLTAVTDAGMIRYTASVNFFPHDDPEDYSISYDGFVSKELYYAKGRRSKKKEAAFLEQMFAAADELAAGMKGRIDWKKPLIEERRG